MTDRTADCGDHWVFRGGWKPGDPGMPEQSCSPLLNSNVSVSLPSQEPLLGHGLKYCLPGEPVVIGAVPHSGQLCGHA